MKNSLKLISYSFERVNIVFPSFPAKGGTFLVKGFGGSFKGYHHAKKKNISAVKWEIKTQSTTKQGKEPEFIFSVVIAGEFDHGFGLSHTQIRDLLKKRGVPILFDVVLSVIGKIMNHSTIKTNPIADITIKKIKYSSKKLPR